MVSKKQLKKIEESSKLYKDFHGEKSLYVEEITLGCMEVIIDLGKAVAIEYECQKKHLGDSKKEIYRHTFKKGVRVYWNGESLIITGGDLTVNERGIIN